MPVAESPLERARSAARRVTELEELARDRDAWAREVARLTQDVGAAHEEALAAVDAAERAETEARAQTGFLAKVRSRIAGNAPEGDSERAARAQANDATAAARRMGAEALLRKLQGDLEAAKTKLLLAEGATTGRIDAKLAERKVFATLAVTGDPVVDAAVRDLIAQEKRCDAWRSAQRAATARRDRAESALAALREFDRSWPALRESLGDVVRGEAGAAPPAALEALRRLRNELWHGSRAGVPGLNQGVLAEIGAIAAHEIDRPPAVARIAAMLTRATQELEPIAAAASKNYAELEANLSTADRAADELRVSIHTALLRG